MKPASWRSGLSELARISAAFPWIILLVTLSASLDLMLDLFARQGVMENAPHLINWLYAAAPTHRGAIVVGLALLVESVFVGEVRWSLRYAPFAVLAAALVFAGVTWADLNGVAQAPPPHPPTRLVSDILVGFMAFAAVGYRIFTSNRKRRLD